MLLDVQQLGFADLPLLARMRQLGDGARVCWGLEGVRELRRRLAARKEEQVLRAGKEVLRLRWQAQQRGLGYT